MWSCAIKSGQRPFLMNRVELTEDGVLQMLNLGGPFYKETLRSKTKTNISFDTQTSIILYTLSQVGSLKYSIH